jgi:hypothetical protein
MSVLLIIIHLGGPIHERPMRSMERCELAAKVYNENVNLRGRVIHYCISVGRPDWTQ